MAFGGGLMKDWAKLEADVKVGKVLVWREIST